MITKAAYPILLPDRTKAAYPELIPVTCGIKRGYAPFDKGCVPQSVTGIKTGVRSNLTYGAYPCRWTFSARRLSARLGAALAAPRPSRPHLGGGTTVDGPRRRAQRKRCYEIAANVSAGACIARCEHG